MAIKLTRASSTRAQFLRESGQGSVHYDEIDSVEHQLYGHTCALCSKTLFSGYVAITMKFVGYTNGYTVCRSCIERALAEAPEPVGRKMDAIKKTSTLKDWISSEDASKE